MSRLLLALPAAALLASIPLQALAGGPPLKPRLHAAPVPESAMGSLLPYVLPRFLPAHPAQGQIAYIDPVTQELVPAPAPGQVLDAQYVRLPDVSIKFRAGVNADGILFLETEGYHETVTATLDPGGKLHVNCTAPDHGHSSAAPAAGEAQ